MRDSWCVNGDWLGEPYWGRGVMPRVVAAVARYAFLLLQNPERELIKKAVSLQDAAFLISCLPVDFLNTLTS